MAVAHGDVPVLGFLGDPPKINDNVDNIVVVDNLPQVPAAKYDKLFDVIQRVMAAYGSIVELNLPKSETDETTGFAFVEYENKEQAQLAVEQGNGYRLDKKHVFVVSPMSEFDKIVNTPDQLHVEPEPVPKLEDLKSWLKDPAGNDQYVVNSISRTTVYTNTKQEAVKGQDRKLWTDIHVAWSPRGSYLATFHRPGIALWGGPVLTKIVRFSHPGVRNIDFSPCEKYLVTWSSEGFENPQDPNSIIVWDVKTGAKLRGFSFREARETTEGAPAAAPGAEAAPAANVSWPVFKWTADDKYFARLGEDAISIYETPSMSLLGKKSLKIKGVKNFAWSPTDNTMAYWLPEESDRPAKAVILSIPDRKELTVKNLYNVKECKVYWQEKGDFLCVQVERHGKNKKSLFSFELFHMRKRLIPCDILEIKDKIEAFHWEPCGNRFSIVHGEVTRSLSFYQLQDNGVTLLKRFDKVTASDIYWSPRGQFCIAALLKSGNGALTFIDVDAGSVLRQVEAPYVDVVQWDPTGRYVAVASLAVRKAEDHGYMMFSFQGTRLQSHRVDGLFEFFWRPRPPTLLTPAAIEDIKNKVAAMQKEFEKEDKRIGGMISREVLKKREQLTADWLSLIDQPQHDRWAKMQKRMAAMRPGFNVVQRSVELEETTELLLSEDTVVLDRLDV